MCVAACAFFSGAAGGDVAFVLDEGVEEGEDGDSLFDACVAYSEVGGDDEFLDAFVPEVLLDGLFCLGCVEEGLASVEADFFHGDVGECVGWAEDLGPVVG